MNSQTIIEWANSDNENDRIRAVHSADDVVVIGSKLYNDPSERVRNEVRYYLSSRFSVLIKAANKVMNGYEAKKIFDSKSLEKFYNTTLWDYVSTECKKMDESGKKHTGQFENGEEIMEHYNKWIEEMDALVREGYENRRIALRNILEELKE